MALNINKDFAIFYGIMMGDGCLSLVYGKKGFISIAGSMADDIPFFNNKVIHIIYNLIGKKIPIKYRNNKNTVELNFMNNELFEFTKTMHFPIGKKGDSLIIPSEFYEKNLTEFVIQGFFATDGSLVITNNNGIVYPRVEANGIAKNALLEMNNYLNELGIVSNFYESKRKENYYNNIQKQYRIQINGKVNLFKFSNSIGFINPKHLQRLEYFNGCTEI